MLSLFWSSALILPYNYKHLTVLKHQLTDVKQFTEVNEMSDGVEPGLKEDQDSGELVQVDVVVQRQLGGQA